MVKDTYIDEKIKKAQEIYARRLENDNSYKFKIKKENIKEIKLKKKNKLLKIITQLFCSLGIYLILSTINKNNLKSNQIIQEIVKKEIDFTYYINKTKEIFLYINNQVVQIVKQNDKSSNNVKEKNNENQNNISKNNMYKEDENIVNDNQKNSILGIGGGDEENIVKNNQIQEDIKYINENFKMIKPLEGIKTSGFGKREPSEIISENHQGIDIAKEEGSKIIAAISGKVIFSGYSESFGNYIKIQNKDIITIYGHCKKIYKYTGENVKIGEEIGEVGMTGNATGPHLHFEIRRENRTIDPELLIEF